MNKNKEQDLLHKYRRKLMLQKAIQTSRERLQALQKKKQSKPPEN